MPTLRQENKGLYWAWKAMKQRCQNPRCQAYRNYGARGITVCRNWQEFEPFCEWALSNGYEKGLDLDRADNDGDYTPENCRWVTRQENVNNRRKTLVLTVDGVHLPRTVWAEQSGVTPATLKTWVRKHGSEYAERRIKDALKNGYTEKDYAYSHRRPIVHESGKRFDSVKAAANYFGLASCTISNAMRENRSTGAGRFTWEEIKDA